MIRGTLGVAAFGLVVFGSVAARADDGVIVARKTFQADVTVDVIATAACSLHPMEIVGGVERAFDVRIGDRRCAADSSPAAGDSSDAFVMVVHIVAWEGDHQVVTLEATAPADAFIDLGSVLSETALLLQSKLVAPLTQPAASASATATASAGARWGHTPQRWYGGPTLAADMAILVGAPMLMLAVAGGGGGEGAILVLPLALCGLAFAGPIVHWSNGHTERGWATLGATLLATTLTSFGGVAVVCAGGACGGEFGGYGVLAGVTLGAAVGLVGSVIVDIATSYEPVPPARSARRVVPVLTMQRDRALVGVGGSF